MIYRFRLVPESAFEYINPAVTRITGHPASAFFRNPRLALTLVVDEDRPIIQALFDDPTAERAQPLLVRWKHADGTVVWTELTRTLLRDETGRPVAVEGVIRDVSREKTLERERDRHAALLAALINNLQDPVMAEDDEGRVLIANGAFSRMCATGQVGAFAGTSSLDLHEHVWPGLSADPEACRSLTTTLRRERRLRTGFEMLFKDGRIFDGDYVPVAGPHGSTVHMWHYRDVTERRQMERRLRESRQRLRRLSAHAEHAREEERRGLARMLHDELGQLFTSIRLELGAAISQFRDRPSPAMRPVVDRLQAAAGLTDLGVLTMRRMTTDLRPPILDHLGLLAAVRWEAAIFSKRTGIRVHVRARPASLDVDDARATALYRILLAALDNVSRHACAGTVRVDLIRRREGAMMEVRDNGRGITEEEIHNPRTMGLLAMRERALALGGEVRITGGRGRGTQLSVTLPDRPAVAADPGTNQDVAARARA